MAKENKNDEHISIQCEYQVKGMHCAGCEVYIEQKLRKIKGTKNVDATLSTQKVKFELDPKIEKETFINQINKELKEDGYELIDEPFDRQSTYKNKVQYSLNEILISLIIAIIVIVIFFLLQKIPLTGNINNSNQIFYALIYGFIASLSSCMAVVGSVVLSISTTYSQGKDKIIPLSVFHISRIIAFFVLGGLLGFIGSFFLLNTTFYFIINTLLFIVMIIMAISMTNLFPSINKFQLRLPKQLTAGTFALNSINSKYLLPAMLGAITFFLPCGFTQAMQFQALTLGNPLQAAITMLFFAIGTLPVLGLISFTSVKLSEGNNKNIFYLASAIMILFFALYTYGLFISNTILPIFY